MISLYNIESYFCCFIFSSPMCATKTRFCYTIESCFRYPPPPFHMCNRNTISLYKSTKESYFCGKGNFEITYKTTTWVVPIALLIVPIAFPIVDWSIGSKWVGSILDLATLGFKKFTFFQVPTSLVHMGWAHIWADHFFF